MLIFNPHCVMLQLGLESTGLWQIYLWQERKVTIKYWKLSSFGSRNYL